jgi:uncharacterized protein (TIGR00730 family)
MSQLKSVCVFCGSSPGADPAYETAARAAGDAIARRGLALVYGGAKVGLMGMVADAALAAGGEVYGVLPQGLAAKELAHTGLTRLEVVGSMHERKARMAELSDAFLTLPGGIGTLEEIFEVWTWGQLGFHAKPAGFLNVAGFYDPLRAFLNHMTDQAFLKALHRDMAIFAQTPAALLDAFAAYQPPVVDKWMEREQL